ncbi:MAG: hypothetical protein U9N14_02965 [Pseudomonadota bacterium]|nr:hypothetical protein [Pseudomonadota bacterium]
MSDFSSYPDPCWFNRLENIKDRNFVRAFLDHDLDRAGRVVADGADPGRINQAWHSELFEMAITAEESEDVRFLVGSGFVPSTDNILCAIDTGCANLFEPVLQTVKDTNGTNLPRIVIALLPTA